MRRSESDAVASSTDVSSSGIVQRHRASWVVACSSIVLSTLTCGFVVSACESDPSSVSGPTFTLDASPGWDAGSSCDFGFVQCGSSCVSTQTDSNHCGACGKACEAGEACRAAECKPVCQIDTDRAQMIYLDAAAIGWADDTQSSAVNVTDGAYHTYELAVNAAGVATVSVDGAPRLTRSGFTTNGTFAVGDQTNDRNVDGTVRIRSVKKVCP